ncbi:hypothetical protein P171DRAFT_487805 [Karstenula rhodostoma CBS 690.94]|uniref:DUF7730 domain-containing protein n=1 Tax=Karstenula rhodostoma CBS 690.94 TaxID=1392251 RepID=A0A9P4PEQ0_9PLEO|nr:hypothetical protein P171DRAFT_487805 [Karstenula rhodostoma CBS 690.94]
MPSGDQTPLFNWPVANSETWDPKTRRHVYPSSKVVSQAKNAVQHLRDIEQRVTAVLNAIDYNTGNIHRMIAEDLASPAAERELALLPKTDYCSVKYASSISEDCKAMLGDKIKRYQRQHAHNLAREEMVDIVLKWQCSADGPQPVRMLPENETAYVNIAHNCRYKYLDWNFEHADEKEEDGTKPDPGECRKPRRADPSIPYPPATHEGGFHSCVIQDLLPFLDSLSEVWIASVQVVVHPRLMTEYEQVEMDAYHAARRQAEDVLGLGKALEKIEEERAAEENEELKHMKARHDYPREELIERETENLLRQDPVNYTSIGTYCVSPAYEMVPRKRKVDFIKMKDEQRRIAKANAATPFLRLPGEILNKIYRFVLGNNVLRQTRTGDNWRSPRMKFLPPFSNRDQQTSECPRDRKNWLSLLLACRQIYSQTRFLPFMWNRFSVTRLRHIRPLLQRMRPEQREKITDIQLEVEITRIAGAYKAHMAGYPWIVEEVDLPSQLNRLLPLVNHIVVVSMGYIHRGIDVSTEIPVPTYPEYQAALSALGSTLTSTNGWSNAEVTLPATTRSILYHCQQYGPGFLC